MKKANQERTLVEFERDYTASMTASQKAKRLHVSLKDVSGELIVKSMLGTEAQKELFELYAERVSQAADLLRVLELEQWRQRESIKLFLARREDESFLRRVSSTWNDDPIKKDVA